MDPSHAEAAAGLFVSGLIRQRQITPALPEVFENLSLVVERLSWLVSTGNVLVALWADQLVGYLGWSIVPSFRGTSQRAAYCCEWGHASIEHGRQDVYQLLYAEAAKRWHEEGCGAHALTTLAHDTTLQRLLFWNGFGMAVIEGMRLLSDTQPMPRSGFTLRLATAGDAESIHFLDELLAEHLRAPTVCMRRVSRDEAWQREFLGRQEDTVWLVEEGKRPTGFLRLQVASQGAADIAGSPDAVGITGAYVLESHRRHGLAAWMLDEATHWYRGKGYARCSVDWESFNPQSDGFWSRHFAPVCCSLIRHVESAL
jgi:GNAT superfamily N-acetyltransferase